MAIDISDLEVPPAQQPTSKGIDISDLEVSPQNNIEQNQYSLKGLGQNAVADFKRQVSGLGQAGIGAAKTMFDIATGPSIYTNPSGTIENALKTPVAQAIKQMPSGIVSGVESFAQDPIGAMYRNPVTTAGAIYGAGKLASSAADSTLGQAILNSPKDLSPEYDALHEAAGISKDLPVQRGTSLRFPNLAGQPTSTPPAFAPAIAPLSYAKDPNTLLNIARARMEGLGDRLSPQELNDYKTLIGQIIDTGKVGSGKPLAMAAQLRSQASDLLNNRVEGLAELNKVYALSSKLRNPSQFLPEAIQNGLQKYGPWFVRAAAIKLGLDAF